MLKAVVNNNPIRLIEVLFYFLQFIFFYLSRFRLNLGPSPPHSDHTDRFFSNDDSNNNHDYNEPQRQGDSDGGLLSAGSSESSFFSIDSKMKECADWKIWGNSCITKANLIAAYLTHNYHRGKRKNY